MKKDRLFTLKELCEILSISTATGKNWLKLNKITATSFINNIPYFAEGYTYVLQKKLQSDDSYALKARKNKTFISGNGIYKAYLVANSPNKTAVMELLSLISANEVTLTTDSINYIIAESALQLLCRSLFDKTTTTNGSYLQAYLQEHLSITPYDRLINDLIDAKETALQFIEANEDLFSIPFSYTQKEDLLGLLYLSLKNIGSRKATGAYYTPTNIVKKLIYELQESASSFENKTILDPSCGTGNFLLQLPKDFTIEQIYGNDIDENSVKITRINLALRYKVTDIQLLYDQITVSDYLQTNNEKKYDYIIGNPPWGCAFTEKEKEDFRKRFCCAIGKSIESYDLFVEQALGNLTSDGILSFVIPEAILNVKSHKPIRELIINKASIPSIEYLGEAFEQVQCPCIILQLKRTDKPFSTIGTRVQTQQNTFTIKTNRTVSSDYFNFSPTDEECRLIKKIQKTPSVTSLHNQADFALGIVTGNNKMALSQHKTNQNEPILKGSDISKFKIKKAKHYIVFAPETFQQSAPIDVYRAPEKLVYRFIGGKLIFAYDNKQTLTLNSCNILIPHIPELHIKYILAILNSTIAQFIFTKQFRSVKVLRSHIEQLPIPVIPREEQEEIVALVQRIETAFDTTEADILYRQLDYVISKLFSLTEDEYNLIAYNIL